MSVEYKIWEKGDKVRCYINHPDYNALAIFYDSKTGPSINGRGYRIDSQTQNLLFEKLEACFVEAEKILAEAGHEVLGVFT